MTCLTILLAIRTVAERNLWGVTLKIREFIDKNTVEKRKPLVNELDIVVDELFPDSLPKVGYMLLTEAGNKKRTAPIIPRINKKKKVLAESSNVATLIVTNSTEQAASNQPHDV